MMPRKKRKSVGMPAKRRSAKTLKLEGNVSKLEDEAIDHTYNTSFNKEVISHPAAVTDASIDDHSYVILPGNDVLSGAWTPMECREIELDELFCEDSRDMTEECISFWEEDVLNSAFCVNENLEETGSETEEDSADILNIGFCEELICENEMYTATNYLDLLAGELSQAFQNKYLIQRTHSTLKLISMYDSEMPTVKLSINFSADSTCEVYVHRQKVTREHDIWHGMPAHFTDLKKAVKLVENISNYNVCVGNPEKEYTDLVPVGAGLSDNKEPGILAVHEGDFKAKTVIGAEYNGTIRTVICPMLVKGSRCQACSKYRNALRRRKERLQERELSNRKFSHSTFKHKDMKQNELLKKLSEQKNEIKCLQDEIVRTKREYDRAITKSGMKVANHQHIELKDLMASCQTDFEKSFPDGNCRQRLFWEQQLRRSSTDARGMKWHPMIIRWCLYMRQKSSKAYESMRSSGFIDLPSSRTLFDYSHYLKSELGLQADALRTLKSEAEKKQMFEAEWRSHCGLLFDEIKIREDLVYDKHTGELVGFCNLDSVGNEMLNFEKMSKKTNDCSSNLAKYMLVVMLRSLTCNFTYPICGFATQSITADFLYPIIWRTVGVLETQLKLKVLFFTCDGASPNRRFFALHRVANEDFVYRTLNPFDQNRNIYFISDVPHLLKTIRNCVSNSFSHKNTRTLWNNGKDISWLHIVNLFRDHCELNIYSPCPKLSRNHVDLVSFNYMKVNLAAQVFSDSVANALEELYGTEVSETVKLIRHVNKFFDCLNVRSLFEGRNKRNPNLDPFRATDDPRFQYLLQDFLGFFDSWQNSVTNRNGLSSSQKAKMLLSYQTLNGLKITVHSICECVKYMLNNGASYIFTHSFNQDPLEQHFGQYRMRGGANNNPSVYEVRNIMTTVRTVHAQALPPKQGNIRRGVIDNNFIDNSPLPRRK